MSKVRRRAGGDERNRRKSRRRQVDQRDGDTEQPVLIRGPAHDVQGEGGGKESEGNS